MVSIPAEDGAVVAEPSPLKTEEATTTSNDETPSPTVQSPTVQSPTVEKVPPPDEAPTKTVTNEETTESVTTTSEEATAAGTTEAAADDVAKLETEFKERYTEKDEEHKAAMEAKDPPAPVVSDYAGSNQSNTAAKTTTPATSTTATARVNGTTNDRKRSRSKSPPYEGEVLKRKGYQGIYSFFVFYY